MAIFSDFKVKFMQKTTTNLNGLWENISANFLGVDLMRLGENLIPVGRWMPPPPPIYGFKRPWKLKPNHAATLFRGSFCFRG